MAPVPEFLPANSTGAALPQFRFFGSACGAAVLYRRPAQCDCLLAGVFLQQS